MDGIAEDKMYVKLRLGIMRLFRSAYAYVDTLDMNALHVFKEAGLRVKLNRRFVKPGGKEDLAIVFVYVSRGKESLFEECMEKHQRNSLLLGWGNSRECVDVKKSIFSVVCVK